MQQGSQKDDKGDWKCIWRNHGWKRPEPKGGNRHPGTGSTAGPKQDKPRQTCTRTRTVTTAEAKDGFQKQQERQQELVTAKPPRAVSWSLYKLTADQGGGKVHSKPWKGKPATLNLQARLSFRRRKRVLLISRNWKNAARLSPSTRRPWKVFSRKEAQERGNHSCEVNHFKKPGHRWKCCMS